MKRFLLYLSALLFSISTYAYEENGIKTELIILKGVGNIAPKSVIDAFRGRHSGITYYYDNRYNVVLNSEQQPIALKGEEGGRILICPNSAIEAHYSSLMVEGTQRAILSACGFFRDGEWIIYLWAYYKPASVSTNLLKLGFPLLRAYETNSYAKDLMKQLRATGLEITVVTPGDGTLIHASTYDSHTAPPSYK